MKARLPDPNFFAGKDIPGLSGYRVDQLIGSGCNAHVFRAYSAGVRNAAACKIIPKGNLIGADMSDPLWRQEIYKAQSLRSPFVVKFWHISDWIVPEHGIDCVVLWSEYISGSTLEKYVKSKKADLSVAFVVQFLRDMFAFLHDMKEHNVVHGDLHAKNILVEDRSGQLGGPDYAFRVTDFGVAPATSQSALNDDYEQLALVLKHLLSNVNYQTCDARDRYTFNILNDHFLARHLLEKDCSRDPLARDPQKLFERLSQIDSEFARLQTSQRQTEMATPFDFLSCEQIGESHALLRALYSDLFLGIPVIEARGNLVLTGPRGCGKSMVFKCLGLKHRAIVKQDAPADVSYLGIYYRCDDLYAAFPRYSLPSKPEAYDVAMHYVTATLVREVLETVELWAKRHFDTLFTEKEKDTSAAVWSVLGLAPPGEPSGNSFRAIAFRLQKERQRAAEKQRFVEVQDQPIGQYFGPHVLEKVCEAIQHSMPFLDGRPFYFFIDDYSAPKITLPLQKNLNRLFMQRSALCFFKLSTESPVSYYPGDIDEKSYVEGREFIWLNLGLVYLAAKTSEKLKFVEDVFARRFHAIPDYPVTSLEELVGSYDSPSDNEVALSIRRGERVELWGKEAICDLCSGDIFYIISLVGRMVSMSGDKATLADPKLTPRISQENQRKSIRGEAGAFLNSVRSIQNGEHLVQVVTAFGSVANSYLKYRTSKNENGNPPHLASRIEPYDELVLSSNAEAIYRELLRYSLFIEDPRGKSRRGKVVPRLYLRRSLLPHFNLTFSKRDSVELENDQIEMLLTDPQGFEKLHRLKSSDDATRLDVEQAANDQRQMTMDFSTGNKTSG